MKMRDKKIIEAQEEIIIGYYNKIGMSNMSVEDIMQCLESDLNYLREEKLLLEVENIINNVD